MIKTGLLSLAAAALFAVTPVAVAQTKAPPNKIAVVDVQKVQQQSRAMKAVRDSLQTLRKKYNKQFEVKEKEMQAEYNRLRKNKDITRIEYERRVRALQADLVKLRRQESGAQPGAEPGLPGRFRQVPPGSDSGREGDGC